MQVKIIKKDQRLVDYDFQKIVAAVTKSADRVNVKLTPEDFQKIQSLVESEIKKSGQEFVPVSKMHVYVELALDQVQPLVAKSYRDYRNYKQDFVRMMDDTIRTIDQLNFTADRSNANTTSALVSTQRTLAYNAFSKQYYKKTFLSKEELQAEDDGFIYIHDISSRLLTYNCSLFDMGRVMAGGFEWENIGYNEPKDVRTACNLISDITMNCASMQYGGFTVPEIDSVLAPYAEKSYKKYRKEYEELVKEVGGTLDEEKEDAFAMAKTRRDLEQGFQGFEHTFNTVASSRGDYPFTTFTGGCDESRFGTLVWSVCLEVRKNGQGHPGHKRPAIFPKLVFLYTKDLHAPGKKLYWLYKEGIECSAKAMYPDWLSLDEPDESLVDESAKVHYDPAIAQVFHRYHKFGVSRWLLGADNKVHENPEWVDSIISPMGCRAYLSPLYKRGGLTPADDKDVPFFTGRFNGGAISLNLPMILRKSQLEKKDFFEVLRYYLDMINQIHIRTYEFLCKIHASFDPVAFTQGGFGFLKPEDPIKPLVDQATFSYGFTALNEIQELYDGKSLYQVRNDPDAFAYRVLKYISDYVEERKRDWKKGTPYIAAIYATPAESLCGTQAEQFKAKYGVIHNVSDRAYFTNSFHMHVSEDITPFEKQDAEFRYFHLASGGHIQYCRFTSGMNVSYIDQCVQRAMKLGFYFGVNIEKSFCNDCGTEMDDGIDTCPSCHSHDITTINRVCGYLGYSKIGGATKMNDAKMAEIHDRKSM